MNSDRPSAVHDLEDAEDRRASNSYLVFLGWIGVQLAGYALLVLSASDASLVNCTGLCFSSRDGLQLIGMVFVFPLVLGQVIVGMLLTVAYNRGRMTSLATGSASFFTTFAVAAVITGAFLQANR
jgi:ABC-type molybdate transport system permease subunit